MLIIIDEESGWQTGCSSSRRFKWEVQPIKLMSGVFCGWFHRHVNLDWYWLRCVLHTHTYTRQQWKRHHTHTLCSLADGKDSGYLVGESERWTDGEIWQHITPPQSLFTLQWLYLRHSQHFTALSFSASLSLSLFLHILDCICTCSVLSYLFLSCFHIYLFKILLSAPSYLHAPSLNRAVSVTTIKIQQYCSLCVSINTCLNMCQPSLSSTILQHI